MRSPKPSRSVAAVPPAVYPPGYFTELIHLNNWPRGWEPAPVETVRDTSAQKKGFSAAKRAAASGTSWAVNRREDE